MEPAVERIRAEVEQVRGAMGEIESRREMVDEVHRRLVDLGTLSAELKDRAEGLRGRMDGAETRFGQLAAQAEERPASADTIAAVTASVGDGRAADGRGGRVGARAREPHPAARRAGGADPAAGPGAGAAAGRAGQGDRAPHPGLGAPAGIGRGRAAAGGAHPAVGATLSKAEDAGRQLCSGWRASWRRGPTRSSRSTGSSATSRGCSTKWESAQAEAAKALEQTLARQGAVEALEAQVKHVFDLAERRWSTSRPSARLAREIEETRAMLQETQAQFKSTEEALQGFEARKRQLERAEQRLARAEALALGIRATVESLRRRGPWWTTRWSRPARSGSR